MQPLYIISHDKHLSRWYRTEKNKLTIRKRCFDKDWKMFMDMFVVKGTIPYFILELFTTFFQPKMGSFPYDVGE